MTLLRASLCLVVAFGVMLAVPAATNAATPATVPTWHVGQAVGYGTNLDLTSLAGGYLTLLRDNLTHSGATVNALNFTGSVDAWFYDQVTGATSSLYTLSQKSASGLKVHFVLNASIPHLQDPGVYLGNTTLGCRIPTNIPTSTRTVAVTVDSTFLENGTSMTLHQVSDLAIAKQVVNATVRASAQVKAYNVPMTDFNYSACKVTVAYRSEDVTLTVNSQDQVRTTYSPALDVFNFPISDGKVWTARANATVGGTISGKIDVQGLNAADQQSFFQNLSAAFNSTAGLSVTGLTGFPIDLSAITVTAGLTHVVQNGVIQDYTQPVNETLRATAAVKSLSDSQQHDVYEIGPAAYVCPSTGGLPYTFEAIYAPDFPATNAGMIVGYQALLCSGSMSLPLASLDNVAATKANQNVQQTEATYNPFPSAGNPLVDFFLASPYWGILLVVAVVAVVAFLLVRRRRKPAMMPPAAQAPPTPPPPSGP